MIYFNNPILNIFLFFIINSIIKIYPLYLLRNNSFKIKDFSFGLVIFFIYSIWLFINNTNFINILKENFINIKNKKIATPGIYYIIKFIKDNKITF